MRETHTAQRSLLLFNPSCNSKHARELTWVREMIDAQPEWLAWIGEDLGADSRLGRPGITCNQVLCLDLLKQHKGRSYEELERHVQNTISVMVFANIAPFNAPRKSVMQDNIKKVKANTWERISVVHNLVLPGETSLIAALLHPHY